ncbi:MAG: endonuclease/exonuclease/phosphatase family protein [Paracoccaceae bacterium]
MRIAAYNVEWFTNLFGPDDTLIRDNEWSGRRDVTRLAQADALGHVFRTLDCDAVMVIEAPDGSRKRHTEQALANFATAYDLRTREVQTGFLNDTQQEIALLYDPERMEVRHDPVGDVSGAAPRFDQDFRIDLDVDATEDKVRFSKPPLELAIRTAKGTALRVIGAHLKSKAPHGATTRDEVMRRSIANRRKQLAQAIWLRRRVEHHLEQGDGLILLGDLNDGPGLDEYENLFGRSSVEIIMGDDLYDPHARQALQRRLPAMHTTARFLMHPQQTYLQALLDYVMISPDLMSRRPAWRIWHPFNDAACWRDEELRGALLSASDHFPVTLDIEI